MWWLSTLAAAQDELALPTNDRPEDIVRPATPQWELAAFGGAQVNDPFLRPLMFGATYTVRLNPILGVEFLGMGSPDLGEADYRPSRRFILGDDAVDIDISRVTLTGAVGFKFTPIYGTLLRGRRAPWAFDLSAVVGTGVVRTADNLEALDKVDDPEARATQHQLHPALQLGGVGRVLFSDRVGWFVDARTLSFVEVIESDTLDMKRPLTVTTGLSFGHRGH